MKGLRMLKGAILGLACGGALLAPTAANAGVFQKSKQTANKPAVEDVALSEGGTLSGSILNEQGIGNDGALVIISDGKGEVARTIADKQGKFTVKNLRGGTYQVSSAQTTKLVRAWAPNTAPPVARDAVVMVNKEQVVRGQLGAGLGMSAAATGAGVAATGVGVYNSTELKGQNDEISKQNRHLREILEAVSP